MSPAAVVRYLAVPLRAAPLLLIVTFSLLLAVAAQAGLLGLPLGFILLSWVCKYGFVLLDHVTDGAVEPPVLSIEMVNPVNEQRSLMLLILVIALFYFSQAATYWLGPYFAAVTGIAVAMLLPAIIAVQGVTGSIAQSLDPRTLFGLIARLRGDYLLILVCIAAFWLFARLVGSTLDDALPLPVRAALLMYAWLAIFAVIGGVLFERRLDIGLDAAHTPERACSAAEVETERLRDRQIDRIYAEWRGGSQANAWQTIQAQLDQSADVTGELRWLYERTARWPDPRLANRIARELLPRVLAQRASAEALDIARESLKRDARFRPISSADLLTLVHLARDSGDRPTARLLLQEFRDFYPDDPAQALVDRLTEQLAR